MSFPCPKGHASTDPDYCSECGHKIEGSTPATSAAPGGALTECPDCGTPRQPGAMFCEACQYDFTGAGARPSAPAADPDVAPPVSAPPVLASPVALPGPAPAPVNPIPPPVTAGEPSVSAFYGRKPWVRVVPDRSLAGPDDVAAFPADATETAFPLDLSENLVGRRSARHGVHPEIPVDDRAVSGRHLKLLRDPTGIVVIDLDSTNGSKLNGTPLKAGVAVGLAPGDTIEIGAWTRLVLEAR